MPDSIDNRAKQQPTFELIAPYRKYFQYNRFHKAKQHSKHQTIKLDELMGRRINQLSEMTFEDIED